mgnify:FL=1
MELFNDLAEYLKKYELSLELINRCKEIFQYGGWKEDDFQEFSKLFSEKAKIECPMLSDTKIKQILSVIYDCGVLTIEDILFIGSSAFSIKTDEVTNFKQISFVWESEDYAWSGFLESTYFFSCPELENLNMLFLQKLRNEISDIFLKYYNISYFPEKLGINYSVFQEYALKANKSRLIDCFLNKSPYDISIICEVKGESTIRELTIMINPLAEKILNVTSINDDVERLSNIIDKSKKRNSKESVKPLNKMLPC